ncbi:MAG: 4Fe-4S dicluster domain-containing protein [Proteobacteria bacterium]|nr:4Fe-4S dicluster domain-containing protein [Pseudomonadota bacterium]
MKPRWGLVIDQERCIGCEACTVACRIENRTQGRYIRVRTEGSDRKDVPGGQFPDLRLVYLPLPCQHCQAPPCAEACPSGALVKRDDGPVMLDPDRCDGCQVCLAACPYGVIVFNEESNRAEKCDLCAHRIDRGLEPFCVICCEGQAMHFGDLDDPESGASRVLAAREAYRLDIEAGTGPSVYYCPPKAPRGL